MNEELLPLLLFLNQSVVLIERLKADLKDLRESPNGSLMRTVYLPPSFLRSPEIRTVTLSLCGSRWGNYKCFAWWSNVKTDFKHS